MVFVPTLDVDAHAGRVWARELVRRVECWALVASESGSSDSNPRPAPGAAARRTVGTNSLQPGEVVVDERGILGAGVLAQGLGAGLPYAASAPAWSTALVGV
jgi:hypothetical protein